MSAPEQSQMFALDPCPDPDRNFKKDTFKDQEGLIYFALLCLVYTLVFLRPTQNIIGRGSVKTSVI